MTQKQQHPKENISGRKHLELLAPAGSFPAAKAVIHAGADAVYLGGERFGARAYAANLRKAELLEIIDYAHLHGCKIYLTVNTLLKQPEIEDLYEYLLPYYEQGLDAVIVQDYGVMQHIRTCFPGLLLHISTQMSVSDACGAAYLKSKGAARIVTARELSLAEIRVIREQVDIEIECFVHGALCYCYSGQCLLSSMLGGRSGNRGRCAQPCRLPYTVLDADRHRLTGQECYPLSLKDLCTIEQIGEFAKAGIVSFKIEGRMKSVEYAAGVTAMYRKYIDAYLKSGRLRVKEKDIRLLSDTGSRSGFTDGYPNRQNGPDMITMNRPAYVKNESAYLNRIHETYVEKEQKIPFHASVYLRTAEPAKLTVSAGGCSGFAQDAPVQAAENQPLSREMVLQQLSKTGNTPYRMDAADVCMDDAVFLPKQVLNRLRRSALDDLTKQILAPYRRKAVPLSQQAAGGSHSPAYRQDASQQPHPDGQERTDRQADGGQPGLYASVETAGQLQAAAIEDKISRVYLDSSMYPHDIFASRLAEHVMLLHRAGKQAYFIFPAVLRGKTACFYRKQWQAVEQAGIDGYLARSQDALGFLIEQQVDQARCVLDHSLYTWSDETKAYYAADGWIYDTVPLELNRKELSVRDNRTSELVVYGYMPLMVSAQCIRKTLKQCDGRHTLCYLKDRYAKEFPVKNNCIECYNTIYNAQPLSLIQLPDEILRLHTAAYRLYFTIETADRASEIIDCCVQSLFRHRQTDIKAVLGAYTYGHFKRGVE